MGALPLVMTAPAPTALKFLGRATFHVVDGLLTAAICLAVTVPGFKVALPPAALPWIGAAAAAVAASTACLGLALGGLSLITRDIWLAANFAYYLLLLLAGVNYPTERLPAVLRLIAGGLPVTHGVAAARRAAAGAAPGPGGPQLLAELLVGLGYLIAGAAILAVLERLARSRATFDLV